MLREVLPGVSLAWARGLRKCAPRTLGRNWGGARSAAFDAELAADTLEFFAASSIPRIVPPIPFGVSQVRFVASLDGVVPLQADDRLLGGPLCSVVVRRR